MDLTKTLTELIEAKFKPYHLNVFNDSYKHAGHREAGEAVNSHFRIEINKDFMDGNRIEKHRAITDAIKEYIDNPIHAIEIKVV